MCLGIPGQIASITDAGQFLGVVSVSGVRREINLVCVVDEAHPIESCVGDWVLVHVGFAMSRIDEAEAARTLQVLTELGEMQRELEAMEDGAPGAAAMTLALPAAERIGRGANTDARALPWPSCGGCGEAPCCRAAAASCTHA